MLRTLQKLGDDDIITEEKFRNKKEEILKGI